MKRIILSIMLMAIATAPTWAQVWHPIAPISTTASATTNGVNISLQGEYFSWNTLPTLIGGQPATSHSVSETQLSGLASVDGTIGGRGVIGGWLASDKQKISASGASFGSYHTTMAITWYELHAAYYFYDKPSASVGVLAGYLSNHTSIQGATSSGGIHGISDSFNPRWTEIALVGSIPLTKATDKKGAQTLGLTVGSALHQDSQESDAISYGVSYTCPLNMQWSIDLSTWELAVEHASTITRAGGGIGYHF